MAGIGYARCSADKQDLTAQRTQLAALGVPAGRVYLDTACTVYLAGTSQ
jgi:DNA invertase Pin-like site-specific DNA recombinase